MQRNETDIAQFVNEIKESVWQYLSNGKTLFVTSSFQTHSIPMLHILADVDKNIPVYFLNTGYHFPETILFKNQISLLLDINVQDLFSPISMVHQKDLNGNLFYTSDPDYCCRLNKTLPLEPILASHDVWITGVRADQSAEREQMKPEMQVDAYTKRYHPMLYWTPKMIHEYRMAHNLPEHPLEHDGYVSIGCEPCTVKYLDENRSGRWKGMKKEECGLHTELIQKSE